MDKVCCHCHEEKNASCFSKLSTSKDGLYPLCRVCVSEQGKEYRAKNKEKLKIKKEKYRKEHKENFNGYCRKFRKSATGKKRSRIYTNKRRFLAKSVENTLTEKEIDFLLFFQDDKCACCGKVFSEEFAYTLDHIIPLSKGGGLTLKNVQLLCRSCNSSKRDKTIQYRKDVTPEMLEEYIFNYSGS